MVSRRSFVSAVGAIGAATFAGVSLFDGGRDNYDRGTLVVENRDSLPHLIEIRVTDGPTTSPAVENERSGTFAIDANETRSYPEFVVKDGRFTVEATLDGGIEEFVFNPQDPIGETKGGTYATVSASESGELGWTVTTVD